MATVLLPRHAVLIGDNNTGKTTLLEALDLVLGAGSPEPSASHRCLCCLLLVMCTHPFAKKAFTLHLSRSEGHERYFGCNLMHRKALASSYQHLMAEAPARREKGYYRGSEVVLSPIGMHQIFEGQARFAQLQFLYFGSGGRVSWDEISRMGMLSGVYVEAFEVFLRLAELEWPQSIDHPTVALFLLVCDLAINPGAGFPLTLRAFRVFIEDVDPGMRFLFLCRSVATKCQELKMAITEYSRDEYAAATKALAMSLLVDSPLAIVETVNHWALESEAVKALMTEHRQFAYEAANLPVRLLLAHFVAFSQDKLARPEFFCWPGAWMAGERASPEIGLLVGRHEAPFIDKAEDAGVYPRLRAEGDEAVAHKAFSTFYSTNVTYDLTRQWISKAGPFEYDYGWLSSGTSADFKAFGSRHFEMVYGVHPNRFEFL